MHLLVYLSELIFENFLRRSNIGKESVQQVPWGLRVDLLLAEVNIRHFNRLSWCEAQHLLRVHTAFKNISEDIFGPGNKFVTWKQRGKLVLTERCSVREVKLVVSDQPLIDFSRK